jgi:hypothetical protein
MIPNGGKIVCTARVYEFDGWTFEILPNCGAWPLKKDGEPRARAGRKFYAMMDMFTALSEDEQKKCRTGGGCQTI